jgi:4'-phosphopantetheinyl transferase
MHAPSLPVPLTLPTDAQGAVDCRLWLIDLTQPVDAAAWQACSPQEHARATRFKFERDARRYKAAHAAMRAALSQSLRTPPAKITWTDGPHGKPRLDAPHAAWHFNLSHSGEWALLGMSRTHQIGVDIECHRDMDDMAGVGRQVFNEAEQQAFMACDPASRATMFYRLWVVKEACLKALGSGLSVDPRCVSGTWSSGPVPGQEPRPAPDWAPARIELPERAIAIAMQVQGLALPIQGESVEGAVALWRPDSP